MRQDYHPAYVRPHPQVQVGAVHGRVCGENIVRLNFNFISSGYFYTPNHMTEHTDYPQDNHSDNDEALGTNFITGCARHSLRTLQEEPVCVCSGSCSPFGLRTSDGEG
eukprot:scaffold62071_cov31-Tisochrysis_lutea.AAC.3